MKFTEVLMINFPILTSISNLKLGSILSTGQMKIKLVKPDNNTAGFSNKYIVDLKYC